MKTTEDYTGGSIVYHAPMVPDRIIEHRMTDIDKIKPLEFTSSEKYDYWHPDTLNSELMVAPCNEPISSTNNTISNLKDEPTVYAFKPGEEPPCFQKQNGLKYGPDKGQVLVPELDEDSERYGIRIHLNCPGDFDMLDDCNYNVSQRIFSNLPANQTIHVPNQTDPEYNYYNRLLNTVPLQPGLYVNNQVTFPINDMMGISHAQKELEVKTMKDENNNVVYYEKDPRIMLPVNPDIVQEQQLDYKVDLPNISNVYDPRFTGYGSSNRSYIDPVMENRQFYYKDVESAKYGNYFIRSKIDTLPFAEKPGLKTDLNLCNLRQRVNEKYMEDTIDFRSSLQNTLMQKSVEKVRQQRMAPIRTF
eukprot:Pgem_evm10s12025